MANAAFTANEEKYTFGNVPVALLNFDEQNVRSDYRESYDDGVDEEIESLAASIAEVGLVEPIIVERIGDVYKLISGERRLRAIKFLNAKNPASPIAEIPAKIYEGIADSEKKLIQLVENLQRKGLSDYDKIVAIAGQFEQLKETIDPETGRKYSQKKYASVVGLSVTMLSFFIAIAKRATLLDGVKTGILTASYAADLIPFDDVDVLAFVERIKKERMLDPARRATSADIRLLKQEIDSRPKVLPFTTGFNPSVFSEINKQHESNPYISEDSPLDFGEVVVTDEMVEESKFEGELLKSELEEIDDQLRIKADILNAEKQRDALLKQTFGDDFFGVDDEIQEPFVPLPDIYIPEVYRLPVELAPQAEPVASRSVDFAGAAFVQGLSHSVNFNNTFGMRTFAISANKARVILSNYYDDIQNLNDMQVFDRFDQYLKS